MRILLLNPIWSYTGGVLPINLTELASFVREKGYTDIHILDLNDEALEIIDQEEKFNRALVLVEKIKPNIVGITCQTIHVPFCVKFTKMLKKKLNIPIVLGGIHPTFRADQMFKLCSIDFIVRGEGEITFVELLDCLSSNKRFDSVLGLSYKEGGQIKHNPARPLIKDLAVLPFPAYDLLKQFKKKIEKNLSPIHYSFQLNPYTKSHGSIIASRGCPYKCLFCSSNCMWKYQRRKPVEKVLKEVDYQIEKLQTNYIRFEDDCLTLNKKWFVELLKGLNERKITWGCLTRIDQIDSELLRLMKEAGCVLIYHGIESGNDKMRRILGKKYRPDITNRRIAEIIKTEKDLNINSICSFMVGIPGETQKDFWDTVLLASDLKNIGADIQLWIMTPYPDIPAVNVFKKELRKLDRWEVLRQRDVFLDEQLILFHDTMDSIANENPDKFLFYPQVGLNKFLSNYEKARDLLGLETIRAKGCFTFNYFMLKKNKLFYINFTNKIRIDNLESINNKSKNIFITINPEEFDKDIILRKLSKARTECCYISIEFSSIKNKKQFTKKLYVFLNHLINSKIKIILTKPLPSPFKTRELDVLLDKKHFCPTGCQNCLELFKVQNGKIIICGGRELGPINAFNGRKQIYSFFQEFMKKNYDFKKNHACFSIRKIDEKGRSSENFSGKYRLSENIFCAQYDKNEYPFISHLLNISKDGIRFKSIKFFNISDFIVTDKDFDSKSYIIFNLISEEIFFVDLDTIILLKQFVEGLSLEYIKKNNSDKKNFKSIISDFLNKGLIIKI